LDTLLDVLTDMFLHSRFDPGDIEKERGVIKEELAMYLDQPHQHVQELLSELMWPGHPLGRSLTGSVKTIDALTRAQMVDFRRRNYVAPCTLVATAGNVKHTQVLKAVGRHARHLTTGRRPAFLPADSDQTQPRLRLFTKRTSQTQMALGIRTCSRHDDRRFALRLLNILLGENMSSRLFQILREDRGLVYDVHSSLSAYEDTGVLVISAGLDTDKLPAVLKLIRHELKRLTDQPPTPAEFRQARDYLLGQLDLGLEGTENQMNWVGDHLLGYGKIIQPSEVKRQLSQVTPAQIRSVARAFICPQRINLALVSPLKRDTGLYDRLQV
jgi:predicted Zn-dependent peptidase